MITTNLVIVDAMIVEEYKMQKIKIKYLEEEKSILNQKYIDSLLHNNEKKNV